MRRESDMVMAAVTVDADARGVFVPSDGVGAVRASVAACGATAAKNDGHT